MAKDTTEAVIWFRKAAEQGAKEVQGKLGRCLLHGVGVKKDKAKAMVWLLNFRLSQSG